MARLVDQLVRATTSAAANYAEACAAESRRDFVHKMQICLKELRETGVWLEILRRVSPPDELEALLRECHELTAIFVSSIRTARRSMRGNR
jgi:four helix bundle protein